MAIGGDYNTALTRVPETLRYALCGRIYRSRFMTAAWVKARTTDFRRNSKGKSPMGLSSLLSYTWSKSIDVASSGQFGVESGSLQDPYNPNESRSVSGFDIPHYFSAAVVYQLPFGRGRAWLHQGTASRILGSWQINSIVQIRSGQPYTLTTNLDIANIGARSGTTRARPDLTGNPHLTNPTPEAWFNTAAYAVPRQFTFGSSGRNQLIQRRVPKCGRLPFP